jgi:hypothetical protein
MKKRIHRLQAFSLIEVAIGLAVTTFCIITITALIPVGINANQDSFEKTTAASLASAVISDLQGATNTGVIPPVYNSPIYNIQIPIAGNTQASSTPSTTLFLGNDGTAYSSATTPGALFRVSLGLYPPASGSRAATAVRVLVTWPAQAGASGIWPVADAGYFETTVALNSN